MALFTFFALHPLLLTPPPPWLDLMGLCACFCLDPLCSQIQALASFQLHGRPGEWWVTLV